MLFASDLSDRCPALGGRGFPGADKYGGHEAAGYVVGLGPGVELVEWVRAASYASPPPDDVRVEVEVAITAGTKANLFGVICRFTAGLQRDHPDPTMYSFAIYADGSYKIEYFEGQQANSRDKVLASGSVPLSVTGFNRVRADCDGSRLTLYLNGQRVVSIEDTRLPTGLSGIRAQSLDAIGARLLFRNLIVSRV